MDIFNFIEVDDHTGLGGQPSPAQFSGARDAGYEVVINLAPTTVFDGEPIDEPALLGGLGIEYHHIAVPWDAPDMGHYARFVEAMDAAADRKALIHCQANYRVTAFYSIYAMERLGWSAAQADALLDRIWTLRPDAPLSGAWKKLIDESRAG